MAGVERQAGALEERGRSRARRVDVLVQLDRPGVHAQADELVRRAAVDRSRRPRRTARHGPRRCTGVPVIPTVGEMSPQGSDAAGTGVADVRRPHHRARAGREGVDGVVLGGDEDPARPRRAARRRARRRGRERSRRATETSTDGDRRGGSVPGGIAVVDGPRRVAARTCVRGSRAPARSTPAIRSAAMDAARASRAVVASAGQGARGDCGVRPRPGGLCAAAWSRRPRRRAGRRRSRCRSRRW